MAEAGAYLTGTVHAKPSIFEIVAQESLASTVEPAFKKIVSYLVLANPRRYGFLESWLDEGYLLFNALLQYHYIKKYSASFSETFYGLKRVSKGGRLSTKEERLSLFVLVVFPHVRNKLLKLSEKYRLDHADGRVPEKKWEKALQRLVVNGYAAFHVVYESLILYRFLIYMAGLSEHPTPLLRMASVTLTYADGEKFLTLTDLVSKIRRGSFNFGDGVDLGGRILTRSLELGAFFLQFIRWWNQENYYTNILALPTPPPPTVPKIAIQYRGLCPICRQRRRIHTALPVSGYVFCYRCILRYVQEHGRCPITNYPAKDDDLVRLYVE